jgi:hypothetical protein
MSDDDDEEELKESANLKFTKEKLKPLVKPLVFESGR